MSALITCPECGGTGTDASLVATDPYPIYIPHPCGYCQGQNDQGEAEMTDEENDITETGQCCCVGCVGMGRCDRDGARPDTATDRLRQSTE